MPIYPYKCINCGAYQELWLDAPPSEIVVGGECNNNGICQMKRLWMAPSLGPMNSSGIAGRPPQQ